MLSLINKRYNFNLVSYPLWRAGMVWVVVWKVCVCVCVFVFVWCVCV